MLYVAFKIHLPAKKSASSKKSKMTLKLYTARPHEWQLQAYV